MQQQVLIIFLIAGALFCNAIGIVSIYEDWRQSRLTILRGLTTLIYFTSTAILVYTAVSLFTKGIS